MEDREIAYFSSINPLARKIIKDESGLKSALKGRWDELNWQEQEALIDDFLVDNSIRQRYVDTEKLHCYPRSFPKLQVETGEKIVVDFENDCWTWQDEHSSPFNWRTKSQQDLTLDDLEPDALCIKPVSKGKKIDTSQPPEAVQDRTEENREFSVQTGTSIWESPFLQGMKKPDFLNRSRSTSPTKSATSRESLMTSRSKTPEEVNYAFTGSVDDLSSSPSIVDDRCSSVSSGEILATTPSHESADPVIPSRRKRSTSKSPSKSLLSSSKKSDTESGSQSLVEFKDNDEMAFDNPVIGTNWSSFVNGQEEEELSSATPSPYKSLIKEPDPVAMDRGDNVEQSILLSGSQNEFQDEYLYVEKSIDEDLSLSKNDKLNASSLSKTGFDFLDNW